ncbi:DsbA family protein [Ornithinimicrobium faecis]|uniref:DsbA family protein n=1 Tax=Ornithinimicrobium faecis TaxID=2934158 RepID=A0ABY4YNP8_9MICO|nr:MULTISPECIES: thioredoxin domain-containing protein [unclassified Ornithinimicrobium]USQ78314.1 DsbA family protein [Ornithinimicrobium sp. HY1793]
MARPPAHVPPPPKSGPPVALIAAVVAIAVAIAAVVAYVVMRPDPVDTATEDGAAVTGVGSSANALPNAGGIVVGDAGDDAPAVHIYQDYQCPWCGLLEQVSGPAFTEAALAGDIQLTYTLMSFLDGNLGTDHSGRAANAAMCADDQGAFVDFNAAVFAGQPDEEGDGWTDEQLIGFAEDSGVEDIEAFTGCLEAGTHDDYVTDMQTRSSQDGISGSPRVFIDGTEVNDDQLGILLEDPNSFPGLLDELAN